MATEVKLDAVLQKKVEAWMRSHSKGCMNCGGTSLTYGAFVTVDLFTPTAIIPGVNSPGFPAFEITCDTCGYVHLFSAKIMGVL